MYKRVLLKLSGEQLAGDKQAGFDTERAKWIANQVKKAQSTGSQIVIMVGGGNYARGAQLTNSSIQHVTGDNVGMLSTVMNAITLSDVFNSEKLTCSALSTVKVDQFIDSFTHRRAISHLNKGRVVIVGGGIGRPFLTTDTAALNLALELNCDLVIKTTKVDGIYDKDPNIHQDATKIDNISYRDALANPDITIMDKAALGLAMEHSKTVVICDLLTDGNIAKVIKGKSVGTLIKN